MKGNALLIILTAVFILASGFSVFVWWSWQNTEAGITSGAEAITELIQANRDLTERLATAGANLNARREEYEALSQEKDLHEESKNEVQEKIDLYESQKNFLKDVLEWYNQRYFHQDPDTLMDAYAYATGRTEP
jgi:hypothetical protein